MNGGDDRGFAQKFYIVSLFSPALSAENPAVGVAAGFSVSVRPAAASTSSGLEPLHHAATRADPFTSSMKA